jgi:hypothetical protein
MRSWRRIRAIVPAVLAAAVLGGCFWEYTLGGGYRPAQTIAVPIFDNKSTRLGQEFDLTQVVAREIVTRTPYRVVGSAAGADLVVKGTILSFTQPALVQGESDAVVEGSVMVNLQLRIVDGRSGRVVFDQVKSDWASLIPTRGETLDTARAEVFDRLALWVVRQLEEPW